MNKHVIVVGSGLGGLTCAYILAKNGYRVTVLEKHFQPGGCLQTFVRSGVKFETGMHYVGSVEEGQPMNKYFKYLGLFRDVQFSSLDKHAYEVVAIDGQEFPCANGRNTFVEQLTEFFPTEQKGIRRYYDTIVKITDHSPVYSLKVSDALGLDSPEYMARSASSFIEAITPDPMLRNVLAGNLPLYAGVYGKTPLYLHAMVRDLFTRSAYRIVGGSDAIARSLAQSITGMGGEVRLRSKVVKISCNDAKAVSATLESGEVVEADYFVSNIHPMRTLELLDTPLIRKLYRERVVGMPNTISNFSVYIKFKPNALPYLNSNYFYYNCGSVWDCDSYTPDDWPRGFMYMHVCSAAHQRFADGAMLMADMHFGDVERWQGTAVGRRGADYEAFKQEKAERLLAELEKARPGTLQHVEAYYTSSPLTYLDYTGTERGSTYGILHDCNEPMLSQISQHTKVPNVFQTGQNIHAHGILGVIIGAIIVAGEFLGGEAVMKQIVNEK